MHKNQEQLNEQKGSLYTIISGLCYGLVGYFGMSIMHSNLSMSNMLFWRFLISSSLVGLLIMTSGKAINEDRKSMLKVFFYGAAFYSAATITYFSASMYIGTGLAMVIFFTYPAIIMLFNWVWHRKPIPKTYYIAIALILIGLIFLTDLSSLKYDMIGAGLGILSAVSYAGYIVSNKKIKISPLISTLMVSLGCMVTFFILANLQFSFVIPTTLSMWSNIFGMGLICTALPILLLLEGLKYISEEKASLLSVLEPVFVVVFGIMLLGEKISVPQIVGIFTILCGALITLLSKKI